MRWEGGWEVAVGDGRGKEDTPSTAAQGSSVLLSPISQDPNHVSSTLTPSKPPVRGGGFLSQNTSLTKLCFKFGPPDS